MTQLTAQFYKTHTQRQPLPAPGSKSLNLKVGRTTNTVALRLESWARNVT